MAYKQNWALINKRNSIGPAIGMAMGKAIDMVIAGKGEFKEIKEIKESILAWRNWIYEENAKKHQELLAKLPKEGGDVKPTETNKMSSPQLDFDETP